MEKMEKAQSRVESQDFASAKAPPTQNDVSSHHAVTLLQDLHTSLSPSVPSCIVSVLQRVAICSSSILGLTGARCSASVFSPETPGPTGHNAPARAPCSSAH